MASVWELLSSSSSSPPFPLFLFGKFDQVASERAALGLKSKPELQLQESLPGFHGDGLWPPVPLGAEQGFPHKGRLRPCSMPRSTHTAGWLQTSQSDFVRLGFFICKVGLNRPTSGGYNGSACHVPRGHCAQERVQEGPCRRRRELGEGTQMT